MRLIVPWELRQGLGDVGPFRETFPPPLVVLGNWVVLGQVERQQRRLAVFDH